MEELAGAPTFLEVKAAVGKLSSGTAPGRNGIRSELFKLGGAVLARRLVKDFAALWPEAADEVDAPPRTGFAKVVHRNSSWF